MASPSDGDLVCRCHVVSRGTIRKAIAAHGLRQVEEVTAATRAAGGCGSCYDDVQAILDETRGKAPSRHAPGAGGPSAAQKRERVVRLLETDLLRLFELNGVSAQLVSVAEDRALFRFQGRGVGTAAASYLSLKRHLVAKMSEACGGKMTLVELNVLEALARPAKP